MPSSTRCAMIVGSQAQHLLRQGTDEHETYIMMAGAKGILPPMIQEFQTEVEKEYEQGTALGTGGDKESFASAGISHETGVSAYVAGGVGE